MAIVTLTTDFGHRDHFVGATKGSIYREIPGAVIVDISHEVSPFNIMEASYILRNAYKTFPQGSIHILGVDSELTPENGHVAMLLDGHYFIGADNGTFSFLLQEKRPDKLVEINIHDRVDSVFPVMDVFVKVAGHIARGGTLEVIGRPVDGLKEMKGLAAVINSAGNQIMGNVIYIDNYGNVVSNISRNFFETHRKGRSFEVWARNYRFDKIHEKYSDAVNFQVEKSRRDDDGKRLALFNSSQLIELAMYRSNLDTVGGAATLMGLEYRDTITVKFL